MTPDKISVARRAVACKGWRWMPGMLMREAGDDVGQRIVSTDHRQSWLFTEHGEDRSSDDPGIWPDLDDPATIGCLLALVREAWEDSHVDLMWGGTMWVCTVRRDGRKEMFSGTTEAEALVAALEAAP
jgi:hypothetical protein